MLWSCVLSVLGFVKLKHPSQIKGLFSLLLQKSSHILYYWLFNSPIFKNGRVSSRHPLGSWTLHPVDLPFAGKLTSAFSYSLVNGHFHLLLLFMLCASAAPYAGSPGIKRNCILLWGKKNELECILYAIECWLEVSKVWSLTESWTVVLLLENYPTVLAVYRWHSVAGRWQLRYSKCLKSWQLDFKKRISCKAFSDASYWCLWLNP